LLLYFFLGVFLTTLTFIQDGQPDKVQGDLINFRKRAKAAEVILDIKRWQSMPYTLTPVQPLLEYIEESLRKYTDHASHSDRLWELSLVREPREREDERMARLLQESGFL
jgi:son of sevenless